MLLPAILFLAATYPEVTGTDPGFPRSEEDAGTVANVDHQNKIPPPVPFGHVFKEGFEDPHSGVVQPVDLLELDTIYMHDSPMVREMIEKQKRPYQRIVRPGPEYNESPRDELYHRIIKELPAVKPKSGNGTRTYWNIAEIQQRNMYDRPERRISAIKKFKPPEVPPAMVNRKFKENQFMPEHLHMSSKNMGRKFTECDEFGKDAKFHPDDIIDLDWVPFYIWTLETVGVVTTAKVHKFRYPTKAEVRKYSEIGKYINKTIDWEQPKLHLTQDDVEMMLIAVDRSGLFDVIVHNPLGNTTRRYNITLPSLQMRLKIVDPYLAMMYCDIQYANIMAVSGYEPKTQNDMIREAAALNISSPGFPVRRNIFMEQMVLNARARGRTENGDKFIKLEAPVPDFSVLSPNVIL